MSVRTIQYTVYPNEITPNQTMFGGVMGEHNATELEFNLDPALLLAIQNKAGDFTAVYRFEAYTQTGLKNSTEPIQIEDMPLKFKLENWLTKEGTSIKVYLIISVLKDDKTLMDMYSFPAVLYLDPMPTAQYTDGINDEGISLLSHSAKEWAATAKESSQQAALAAERTLAAKIALEDGAELIFLGGDAKSEIDIDLVVDDTPNEFSANPLQNSAVFGYVKSEIQNATEQITKQALLLAHPIGSYYWSDHSTDPSRLFGGEWEQVTDTFILAAGQKYTAGDKGGSDTHSHTLQSGYAKIAALGGDGAGIYQKRVDTEVFDAVRYTNTFINDEDIKAYFGTELGGSSDNTFLLPPYEVAYCFKRIN